MEVRKMQQQNASVYDTLVKAFEESNSETIDLVVEHELRGVTPEMIAWWEELDNQWNCYYGWGRNRS